MFQQHTVSEAGEEAVLAGIAEVIEPHNAARGGLMLGPGDDAAALNFGQPQVVMTTDTMADGRDFRRHWWRGPWLLGSPEAEPGGAWPMDVGTKAAVQNLSDINAMGTTTKALLVSLTLPPQTPLNWVQNFYRGVIRACQAPGADGCLIAGGDLASGERISVTMTALGEIGDDGGLLTRSAAEPGDVLAVCGQLGYAGAGLALLEQPGGAAAAEQSASGHKELLRACVRAQVQPAPPLRSGAAALAAGAPAGMDLSDGLLRDAARLARASRVSIRCDDAALAAEAEHLQPVAAALGTGPEALEWVLAGGEDYSLLATFPAGTALPAGFRQVGSVVSGGAGGGGPAVLTEHRVTGAGWDSVAG